jgi:hypothetical protein
MTKPAATATLLVLAAPVSGRYGPLTIFSMATPCVGTLVAVYESLEVPRSFWA